MDETTTNATEQDRLLLGQSAWPYRPHSVPKILFRNRCGRTW